MIYQFWGGVNTIPSLTSEQWLYIKNNIIRLYIQIGINIENRVLYKGLGSKSQIDQIIDYLTQLNKQPEIYDVRDKYGIRYGFQEEIDENLNTIIVQNVNLTPYPYQADKIEMYLQPFFIEGEQVTPINNTVEGFATYDKRIDI